MTIILPRKKQKILSFLKDYISSHGFAPTLSEIAEEFNVKSLSTIHEHLAYLEDNGFINRSKNQAREIEIIEHESAEDSYLDGSSVMLPVVGMITAGEPIEAIEDPDSKLTVPASMAPRFENMFVLKVKGDSMIESMIADGDYVVIEKSQTANNGDIIVALLNDGTATLKKFYKEKNEFRLQPANKNYKPIRVKELTIQGKVRGVIRQVVQ